MVNQGQVKPIGLLQAIEIDLVSKQQALKINTGGIK